MRCIDEHVIPSGLQSYHRIPLLPVEIRIVCIKVRFVNCVSIEIRQSEMSNAPILCKCIQVADSGAINPVIRNRAALVSETERVIVGARPGASVRPTATE